MPYTIGPSGDLVWVDETPDRTTPAPKPTSESTIIPELEGREAPAKTGERVVQLVDPHGGIFEVAESGVTTALESGRYKLATPDEVDRYDTRSEREGALATLKAFGHAAGRAAFNTAALPGELLDRGAVALGAEPGQERPQDAIERQAVEERRQLAQDNPTANLLGNIAGSAVGGAAVGGGAGALAEGLGASRAIASGVAGAAEGAVQNYTVASEDAYFENRDLTSEQMMAAMGWGALIGGGVGLGVGKAQELLFSRAGSRGLTPFDSPRVPAGRGAEAGEAALESGAAGGKQGFSERFADELRSFSEERVTKAVGARGSDIRKLGRTAPKAEAEMRRMARDVLEGELDDGTKIFRPVQSQEELVGNLVRAREEAGAKLGAFREKIGSYIDESARDLRPKTATLAERIENEVVAPLRMSQLTASEAGKTQLVADELRGLGEDVSLPDLRAYQEIVKKKVYPQSVGSGLPPLVPEGALELQKTERIIEEAIEAATDKAAAKMGGGSELAQYGELKAKFRSYREAAQIAGKAQIQDLGNRVVSPSDYGVGAVGAALGGILGGGPIGASVMGAAAAAAHKVVREHSSAVLAVLADRLAKTVDRRVARGLDSFFERQLGSALRAAPANMNAAGTVRRVSASTGRTLPAAAALAATPMAMFLGKETDKQEAYRKRAKEILDANAEYGARVRGRVEETLGELAPQAPKLAASMTMAATRGAQFLGSKLPAPIVNARSFTPSRALPVSEAQLDKFAKYWATVSSPMSVLEDLKVGRLAPEQVEALQAVYPQLYRSIVTKVQERLGELDQKGVFVPYRARLQLDLLLDMKGAGEPTASPASVALFQQIRQMAPGSEQEERPTPPAKPVNIASRLRSGRDAFDPGAQQP